MFAALHDIVAPLLERGWVLVSTERDVSWEHGDSVFYDLEREGLVIELEYYEQGDLVAYPMGDDRPMEEDGVTEAYFVLDAPSQDECWRAFVKQGWMKESITGA